MTLFLVATFGIRNRKAKPSIFETAMSRIRNLDASLTGWEDKGIALFLKRFAIAFYVRTPSFYRECKNRRRTNKKLTRDD
ncbi:hypothetical protein BRARA_F01500 [Brassica rapa]|uniref:Uncharacterized protein n=1 Tax=Brassica campestris TaxID=3711 RepID=A0A397YXI9_BRACM|nr:hypothetical protein BRARA_F01500 [Brassica rapa]